MSEEKELIDLMRAIEGSPIDGELSSVTELRQRLDLLRETPLEEVPVELDDRMQAFIHERKTEIYRPGSNTSYKYMLAAAVALVLVLLTVFTVFNSSSIEQEYGELSSNTDRLNYIFDLYDSSLSSSEIDDLKQLVSVETNPNVKVAMLDVLVPYSESHFEAEELIQNLEVSKAPSVQMAVLNLVEKSNYENIRKDLERFRTGEIDKTVSEKIQFILSKNQSKNGSL